MGTGSLPRGYSGRRVALTTHPPSSADVKERVQLYVATALLCLHELKTLPKATEVEIPGILV